MLYLNPPTERVNKGGAREERERGECRKRGCRIKSEEKQAQEVTSANFGLFKYLVNSTRSSVMRKVTKIEVACTKETIRK